MDRIKEVTKNFLVCAFFCIITGIGLVCLSKMVMGVFTLVAGVVFLVMGIVLVVKDMKSGTDSEK